MDGVRGARRRVPGGGCPAAPRVRGMDRGADAFGFATGEGLASGSRLRMEGAIWSVSLARGGRAWAGSRAKRPEDRALACALSLAGTLEEGGGDGIVVGDLALDEGQGGRCGRGHLGFFGVGVNGPSVRGALSGLSFLALCFHAFRDHLGRLLVVVCVGVGLLAVVRGRVRRHRDIHDDPEVIRARQAHTLEAP